MKTLSIGSVVYIEGKEYNKAAVTKHCKDNKVTITKDLFEEVKSEANGE